mgnify:CR=1 FL=1
MKKAKFYGNCWLWPYAISKGGYGMIRFNGKTHRTHKWFYEIIKGSVPFNCELDHLCRETSCMNPEHLEVVSHTENLRRGSRCKLTLSEAEKIRTLHGKKSQKEIAKIFGVSEQTIKNIFTGKTWG